MVDWDNLSQRDREELIRHTLAIITTPFEGTSSSGLPLQTNGLDTDTGRKALTASVTMAGGNQTKIITRAIVGAHDKIEVVQTNTTAFGLRFNRLIGREESDDRLDFEYIGSNLITAVANLKRDSDYTIIDCGTF
jgi:hypothetical protein